MLVLSKQERRMVVFLIVGLVVGAAVNLHMRHREQRLDNMEAVAAMDSLRREFVARAAQMVQVAPVAGGDSVAQPSSVAATTMRLRPVDINRASAAELEKLPHIGPALAQRIVAYREQWGPFRSIEEIKQVKGIGERTFARIRPYLTIG
ncbi:MAG: ComEA family DNA-binding protein [Candidatus Oleimicrobiaceae bacterium]